MQKPKIMIISNNVLSKTANNGKTLYSFFGDYKDILQIYFSPEIPKLKGKYIQINENLILKNIFNPSRQLRVHLLEKDIESNNINIFSHSNIKMKLKKNILVQFLREFIWFFNKSKYIDKEIKKFKTDIIFFCAGDTLFSYRYAMNIAKKYNLNLVIYVTDDYITYDRRYKILTNLKKFFIRAKLKQAINFSSKFYTISPKMKQYYKETLNVNSENIVNISSDLYLENREEGNNIEIKIVYAGGLHLNRDKSIIHFLEELSKIKKVNKKKYVLDIYTASNINLIPKKYFDLGIVNFKGLISPEELRIVLNNADFLLFVESFDFQSILSTKYSLSTKIPEYLSVGKPIIAIGPSEISSIEYLNNCAFIINKDKKYEKLITFFDDKNEQINIAKKAREVYLMNHNPLSIQKKLLNDLIEIKKGNNGMKYEKKKI